MSEQFKERRRHPRFDHHFLLFFYLKNKKEVTYEASEINNISLSGINFSSCTKFDKGSLICIELKTPFTEEILKTEGVLITCVELIPDRIYRMHIEFKDIPQQTMDVLKKIETYKIQ